MTLAAVVVLRHHKESVHYRARKVQCPKCNKKLNREDNIKYYKLKQNEVLPMMKDCLSVSNKDSSSSIDMLLANHESFDKTPAKRRKYLKCSAKSDLHKDLENKELTKSDPEI